MGQSRTGCRYGIVRVGPQRVELSRLDRLPGRSVIGAQRKQVTFPTDFRSQPENGRSRYGHRTARFAP
jgi:hypothetical protein